jgi:hypothetical protein
LEPLAGYQVHDWQRLGCHDRDWVNESPWIEPSQGQARDAEAQCTENFHWLDRGLRTRYVWNFSYAQWVPVIADSGHGMVPSEILVGEVKPRDALRGTIVTRHRSLRSVLILRVEGDILLGGHDELVASTAVA